MVPVELFITLAATALYIITGHNNDQLVLYWYIDYYIFNSLVTDLVRRL